MALDIRWPEFEEGEVLLAELGPDGRRLRQVEIGSDGDAVKTSVEDLTIHAPFDLHDPQRLAMKICRGDFEAVWRRVQREPVG
ncbi:hypothetical protein ACWGQ4_11690 [Streptomyces sp. NPDC055721]|uniref:hypothetical protein n=1 Tax=Streptomyces sp. NPDC127132 TaxID=3345374 RepID=UPI0036410A1A